MLTMRCYRVYFKKNGINLTKLVYAESMSEIYIQFKGLDIIMIKQIDLLPDGDVDIISLN
jgi:hypothetical protein